MIITDEKQYREAMEQYLTPFSGAEGLVIIIVDPYYGGYDLIAEERIESFIYHLLERFVNPHIVWFHSKNDNMHGRLPEVTTIDLSRLGEEIHDRFIFIYDQAEKFIVKYLHLGGSLNGASIDGKKKVSLFRLSELETDEIAEATCMLSRLERIYRREMSKSDGSR